MRHTRTAAALRRVECEHTAWIQRVRMTGSGSRDKHVCVQRDRTWVSRSVSALSCHPLYTNTRPPSAAMPLPVRGSGVPWAELRSALHVAELGSNTERAFVSKNTDAAHTPPDGDERQTEKKQKKNSDSETGWVQGPLETRRSHTNTHTWRMPWTRPWTLEHSTTVQYSLGGGFAASGSARTVDEGGRIAAEDKDFAVRRRQPHLPCGWRWRSARRGAQLPPRQGRRVKGVQVVEKLCAAPPQTNSDRMSCCKVGEIEA